MNFLKLFDINNRIAIIVLLWLNAFANTYLLITVIKADVATVTRRQLLFFLLAFLASALLSYLLRSKLNVLNKTKAEDKVDRL